MLAGRVADGMRQAWDSVRKLPITARDVGWTVQPVALPPATYLNEARLIEAIKDKKQPLAQREAAALRLVWLRRCLAGETIDLSCLRIGSARILHMPGELFVEYQLAAQAMRPDLFVAMAAYGEYAPAYIGTAIAYDQGGYETQQSSSNVSPQVEGVLLDGLRNLLGAEGKGPTRLGIEAAKAETELVRKRGRRNLLNGS